MILFKNIYLHVDDEIDNMVAAEGVLYSAGIVDNVDELFGDSEKQGLLERFVHTKGEEKKKLICDI